MPDETISCLAQDEIFAMRLVTRKPQFNFWGVAGAHLDRVTTHTASSLSSSSHVRPATGSHNSGHKCSLELETFLTDSPRTSDCVQMCG